MAFDSTKKVISGINVLDSNVMHIGDKLTTTDKYLVFGRDGDNGSTPSLRFHAPVGGSGDGYGWQYTIDGGSTWVDFNHKSFSDATAQANDYLHLVGGKWTPITKANLALDLESDIEGVLEHNSLQGLQGGNPTDGYYHLTTQQHTWLTELVSDGYVKASKGGTGLTTVLGDGYLLVGSDTEVMDTLAPPTLGSGQILQWNGTTPVWTAASASDVVSVVACGMVGPLEAGDGYLLPAFASSTDQLLPVFLCPLTSTVSSLQACVSAALDADCTFTVLVGDTVKLTATIPSGQSYILDTGAAALAAGNRVTVKFSTAATNAADVMVNFQVTKTVV